MRHRSFVVVLLATLCLVLIGGAGIGRFTNNGRTSAQTTPITRPRTVTSNASRLPDLGAGASLHGVRLFPPDNPWNQDVSNAPVDSNSARLIASIGIDAGLHPDFGTVYRGAPNGIPYIVVAGSQPRVPITFTAYGSES